MMERASVGLESLLIGRQREYRLLWSHYEAATRGQMRVVFAVGEPGIGKTRLLNALAMRAQQEDAYVLRGGASDAEGMPPYLPFLEALGQHVRAASLDVLREQLNSSARVLATILPEISLRLGTLPDSYPLPPEQARLRLYETVGALLATIAATRPLLVLLDDLQWADSATLDLLCHVARHQPDARLLVLGAYREGEVVQRPSFERTLAELTRLRRLTVITIGPLATDEIATLALKILGAPLDTKAKELLAIQCEGNPFFAEELLQDWLETGTIRQQDGCFCLVSSTASVLPASIVTAVRQRVNRLSSATVTLLHTAAMIGRTFDVSLLARVVAQEAEAAEEHLWEAARAKLIRTVRPGTFTFSHDIIRTCLYDEIGSTRRTRLHTLVGRMLQLQIEQKEAVLDARHLADLAFHFARSGDRERGAAYAQQAATYALQTYAAEEAIAYYRTALTLLDRDAPGRASCWLGLGEAMLLAGFFQEAISVFGSAREWYLTTGDTHTTGRAALGLGRAHWRLESIGSARLALEQAVTLLSGQPSTDTAEAMTELGSLLTLSLHEYTEARKYLDQALRLAQQLGDSHLEIATSRALGNLLLRAGDMENAMLLLEQVLVKAEGADDVLEAAEICSALFLAYNWVGVLDRQEKLLQRWLAHARRCHDPYYLRHIYTHLAVSYALRGERARAEEALTQSQAIVEQLASPEPLTMLQLMQGAILSLWGELDQAEKLMRASIARFRELEPRSLVWWLGGLGFVLALQDKRQEALACMNDLESLIAPLPDDAMPTVHTLCYMGAIAGWLADRDWAARLYPRLLPFRGQIHSFSMDRLLGVLATLLGDFPAARAHLTAAEMVLRQNSFKAELASLLVNQADLEQAEHGRASIPTARSLLEEALALFQQWGNTFAEHQLRERLRHLSRTGARPRLPAGLSRREVEVLRLVAQGKTNREIAKLLTISERTVANHLASIFAKTGVDNRAAATAFALRHDLAE